MKRQIIIILFALVVIAGQAQNTFEGHEYVDLGLPSGTLWATCNVGANSPEEYGDYFAWGETKPKESYRHESYQYDKDRPFTSTKYCADSKFGYNGFTDDLTELLPEDDAATANWGSGWQMPSMAQTEELYNNSYTTTEWTTQNGVNGRKITSKKNGNSIFLPAAGFRCGTKLNDASLYEVDSSGYYWSRSLYTINCNYACSLSFDTDDIQWDQDARDFGQSVRPVRVIMR